MLGISTDDGARLAALHEYDVLDTPPEQAFDDITAMCADLLGVPIALMTLVDADRQWFKSRVGLEASQTARSVAFCDHAIRDTHSAFVVEDACQDPRFYNNPLVTGDPRIRFYAGVPLVSAEGFGLGTLCAIDRTPRRPSLRDLELLTRMARQVEVQLEYRRRQRLLERELDAHREKQRERERLGAMLVHDLRNPVAAIMLAADLSRDGTPHQLRESMADILECSREVQELLQDAMDVFLGDSGKLRPRRAVVPIGEPVLQAVRSAARAAQIRRVRVLTDLQDGAFSGDRQMTRRILANLIDNAVRHAPEGSDVRVRAKLVDGHVHYEVADTGEGLSDEDRERIFAPYMQLSGTRGSVGLGLAFCRLAAAAHGGRVWVEDNQPRGSRFVVRLPAGPQPPTPAPAD